MKQERSATPQARFTEEYKFVSACAHCGKPMGSMSISTVDREPEVMGQYFRMDVFKVWIDPTHDCTYLNIAPKAKEAA